VKTAGAVEGRIDAVPAAISSRELSCRELAEWLQQLVVVKAEEKRVVGVELLAHRSFQKLDLVVVEGMDAGMIATYGAGMHLPAKRMPKVVYEQGWRRLLPPRAQEIVSY